jgi:hypothetical protein
MSIEPVDVSLAGLVLPDATDPTRRRTVDLGAQGRRLVTLIRHRY